MKLHLNLTLRRAVLAAMAMVALHTAQAENLTYGNGHADAYISGEGTITSNEWNEIWNKHKAGSLTIGTSAGAAIVDLTNATYNKGQIIFIGGVGNNSGATTANNGELIVNSGTKVSVSQLNVGNSMVGGTGTLTMNGGSLNVGNTVYVGVNYGNGIINATNGASITIASGSTGAVFAISHREITPDFQDTVTLTNSSITVGTEGGVLDYTAIGHSRGTAELTLDNSTATFADQVLVGEKTGSNGTIHVHNNSKLNLGATTVLGAEQGAYGEICAENSTIKGSIITIGKAGDADVTLSGKSSLTATEIVVGSEATGGGSLDINDESSVTAQNVIIASNGAGMLFMNGGSLTAEYVTLADHVNSEASAVIENGTVKASKALTIGDAGSAALANAGTLESSSIVLGNTETGVGSIQSTGTIKADTLFIGAKGTGAIWSDGGTVTAKDAYIVGTESMLSTAKGTTDLTNATVLAGTIQNLANGTTNVTGELILVEAGTLFNSATTNINKATVSADSNIDSSNGTITITTLTNDGSVTNGTESSMKINSATNMGQIENDGTMDAATLSNIGTVVNYGSLDADSVTNEGSIDNIGSLTTSDLTNNSAITNDGLLTATNTTNEGSIDNIGSLTTSDLTNSGAIINDGLLTATNTTNEGSIDNYDTLTTSGLTNSGAIINDGSLTATNATNEGSIDNYGTLTTSGLTNSGTIINAGTWNASGSTDISKGSFTNNAYMNASGTLTTAEVAGTGEISNEGEWAITGQTEQQNINNSGKITITGNGSITTGELAGTGSTTILVDGTTKSTGDQAVIQVNAIENRDVAVHIDTTNASSLVGKTVNFLKIGDDLIELGDQAFSTSKDWFYNWTDSNLFTGEAGNGQQLSFTGGTDGITFTKLGAIETKKVEAELPSNVTVELEVTTETVLTVTDTLENKGESIKENQSSITITETDTLQSAELSQGVDKNTQEEVRTNVIIGKNVESTGDADSTKVQSVVVTQKTTIETPEGEENIEMKETLSVSGVALVFEGKSEHKGNGKAQGSELGFKENTETGTLTTTKNNDTITVQNTVSKVDIMEVKENAEVDVKDISMHSTHALTISAGSTITFENVDLHVGGTEDVNLAKEVQVVMYDETGKPKTDEDGNVITKTETVDSGTHLTVDTTITNAKVEVKGDSVVKFEKIYDPVHGTEMGSTTITKSEVEIDTNAVLGDNGEHMDEIAFTDNTKVNNSGKVNNAKFDNSELQNNNGTVDNVVISNGSHLKGKGNLKKVHVDKDSTLTVGSSPGKFTANELTVDGKTNFYIITNSDEWTTKHITATEGSGAISQLVVEGPVTLNGAISFIYQEKLSDGTYADCANQAEARDFMADKFLSVFEEGDTIQFVTGDDLEKNITFGSSFSINTETLPTLEEGMFWDTTDFFTQGTVTVMAEILEEPTRIANTLVSAGETVLNFGRVAESQAELREAGTTRTWASALAMFDSIDTGKTTNGYDYNAWGAAVGVDHAFTKNTVVGVAFGCTWGENESKENNDYYTAGSVDQDSKMVALYGTHKFQTKGLMNDVKLNAFAAYGWFENDSTREGIKSGHTATAEWDSNAWVLSASLSRDITTDDGVVFTPYVGVEYTKATMDDFSEKGKSYSADYTADEDYSNLSVKVGVTVSKTFGSFTPYAGIAYINDVDRKAAEVTAKGKRTVEGKSALPGRDALQLRAGATWQLTETLDVNAGYSAEIRNKATEHNANVGIGLTF